MLTKLLLLLLPGCTVISEISGALHGDNLELPERHGDKFYYFGYGSNMLAKRIHIQNPSAQRIGPGQLMHYRLDFNTFTARWKGAPATVVPTQNASVWGTLWDIDMNNLDDIDDQEGVHAGVYYSRSVPIVQVNGEVITARTYMLADAPKTELRFYDPAEVPPSRQPSKTYLQCLVHGAIESGIDASYVEWLRSIKHNGAVANDLEERLELKNVQLLT